MINPIVVVHIVIWIWSISWTFWFFKFDWIQTVVWCLFRIYCEPIHLFFFRDTSPRNQLWRFWWQWVIKRFFVKFIIFIRPFRQRSWSIIDSFLNLLTFYFRNHLLILSNFFCNLWVLPFFHIFPVWVFWWLTCAPSSPVLLICCLLIDLQGMKFFLSYLNCEILLLLWKLRLAARVHLSQSWVWIHALSTIILFPFCRCRLIVNSWLIHHRIHISWFSITIHLIALLAWWYTWCLFLLWLRDPSNWNSWLGLILQSILVHQLYFLSMIKFWWILTFINVSLRLHIGLILDIFPSWFNLVINISFCRYILCDHMVLVIHIFPHHHLNLVLYLFIQILHHYHHSFFDTMCQLLVNTLSTHILTLGIQCVQFSKQNWFTQSYFDRELCIAWLH